MTKEQYIAESVSKCENAPKQSVARIMRQEHPEWFPSVDSARSYLRYRTGSRGHAHRERSGVMSVTPSTIEEGLRKLRSGITKREKVIKIVGAKVGVLSDIHIPYQDHSALSAALAYLHEANIDALVFNGDILDNYRASRFSKEPGRMTPAQEYAETRKFLALCREIFPNARMIYKFGNHEARIRQYLITEAKELADIEELRLEELLGLKELGIEHVEFEKISLGKLTLMHGHELPHGIAAPVNPARGVFLKAKASTMVGHHHQTSHHSEGDINGKRIGCWSLGCLCDLSPDYNRFAFTKWNHGCAIVDVAPNGDFHVDNRTIIDGRII